MLRKCSMTINIPETDGITGSAYGELPRLHVLQLTFVTLWRHQPVADVVSDELRGVFDHIHHTPSLTHLSITASLPERLPQVPFLELLDRSSCQLKALEIHFPVSDSALEQCLRLSACSSLSCLIVNEIPTRPVGFSQSVYNLLVPTISASLLTTLTSQSTTNTLDLCPLLERVAFQNCTCTSERDVRRLIDFIEIRSKRRDESNAGARQLKFVVVSFAYDIGDEYLPGIEAIREREGVQIWWRYERRRRAGDSPEEGLRALGVGQEPFGVLEVDKEWL